MEMWPFTIGISIVAAVQLTVGLYSPTAARPAAGLGDICVSSKGSSVANTSDARKIRGDIQMELSSQGMRGAR